MRTNHRVPAIAVVAVAVGLVLAAVREVRELSAVVSAPAPTDLAELGIDPPVGLPAVVLVADPACGACRRSLADWETIARPEELGFPAYRIDPPPGSRFLLPVYLLFDANGTSIGALRGYHPPETVSDWIRTCLERSAP